LNFFGSVITILGSSSLKIRKEAELFPGRRGRGKDVNVLPLTFKEYIKLFNVKKYDERIYSLFNDYLKEGGFPLSINKSEDAKHSFISAFESEITKSDKSIKIAKQIITSVLRKAPSAMSYHAIASDIGISHKTVAEYLDLFEEMFLLKQAFFMQDKKIDFKKEKKIFFMDPFIAHTFSYWLMQDFLESALYEWVIQAHLARKYGEVYYWKNKYEIDCIANDLKVEVKAAKPYIKYPKGVKILDKQDIPTFLLNL
jgi:predicted AAA+ superfamily ATPase